jgi:hypothetical protein
MADIDSILDFDHAIALTGAPSTRFRTGIQVDRRKTYNWLPLHLQLQLNKLMSHQLISLDVIQVFSNRRRQSICVKSEELICGLSW